MSTVGKLVILKLDGDFEQSGFHVALEIGTEQSRPSIEIPGKLPPNPDLVKVLKEWRGTYRSLEMLSRISPQKIIYGGSVNRQKECQRLADELRDRLNAWLESKSFQAIDRQLREALKRDESIRVLIRTQDRELRCLPWHLWDFVERYPSAEVALCASRFESIKAAKTTTPKGKVRILAILGNSTGINIEHDRSSLKSLPNAKVTFLPEPKRNEINDHLWDQPWDILFFAGHSQTEGERGRIYINSTESLTISELKYGLEQAISQGLKLAIFNSCDGLGLAHELEQLHLPQLIVMREPVPDQVAQKFAKYFLNSFASGDSLYLAERKARQRLHGLENQFPCASWLPVICQNSAEAPPTWGDLRGEIELALIQPSQPPVPIRSKLKLRGAFLISFAVAGLVISARLLGLLEPAELWAFDRLMQWQPKIASESPVLIVAATDADVEKFGRPLSDLIVHQVLTKLEKQQPRVIGLDIFRPDPTKDGWNSLIKQLQKSDRTIALCRVGEVKNGVIQPKTAIAPPPGLHPDHSGFSDSLIPDPDGVIRRYVLAMEPRRGSLCATANSFSFQVVRQYLSPEVQYKLQSMIGIEIIAKTDKKAISTVRIPRLQPDFGGYQRSTADVLGYQLLIDYRHEQAFQKISLTDILNASDADLQQLVKNRIVLVGYESGDKDYHSTSLGKLYGVTIHAHVIRQVLDLVLHQRPLISAWSKWGEALWISIWSVMGVVFVWFIWSSSSARLIPAIMLFVLVSSSLISLAQAVWLPLIPSALAFGLTSLTVAFAARKSQKFNFYSNKRSQQ